jgi:hypothetical protein
MSVEYANRIIFLYQGWAELYLGRPWVIAQLCGWAKSFLVASVWGFVDSMIQCLGILFRMIGHRALHGSPMGDPFKNGKPMGTHGYPLVILQISLLKPNAQRQDTYRLKACLFLH